MVIEILLLLTISCLWVYSRQLAKKLADSTKLLQEASNMIADLGDEIAKRDGIIARNDYMWKSSVGYTESLQSRLEEKDEEIQKKEREISQLKISFMAEFKEAKRLRAELKKRTDQYNELVDLAREKGIIGE